MYLQNLKLINFKNYHSAELVFSDHINCFVGVNGVGKTNLLDAIHYLCLTRSALNNVEQYSIKHGEPFYMAQGEFLKNDKIFPVLCSFQRGKKKTFKLNKKDYEKVSEHIGLFPAVLMMPTDTDLVREGSETRRKFFDSIISQLDKLYLQDLIQYNHALKQRNALLKQFAETHRLIPDLLEPYDLLLLDYGQKIYEKRQAFISDFIPTFQEHYQILSGNQEQVSLEHQTEMGSNFEAEFRQAFKKDCLLQRTTMGVHKDDYKFMLEGHLLKKYGSQGQQKSFVVALKLAQFEFMHKKLGHKPILLMDDIFDKLDDNRIQKLLDMLTADKFGQVFITDARPERTQSLLGGLKVQPNIIDVEAIRKEDAQSE